MVASSHLAYAEAREAAAILVTLARSASPGEPRPARFLPVRCCLLGLRRPLGAFSCAPCGCPVSQSSGDRINRRVRRDRKSTRLNSSHVKNSYAVCCLQNKQKK